MGVRSKAGRFKWCCVSIADNLSISSPPRFFDCHSSFLLATDRQQRAESRAASFYAFVHCPFIHSLLAFLHSFIKCCASCCFWPVLATICCPPVSLLQPIFALRISIDIPLGIAYIVRSTTSMNRIDLIKYQDWNQIWNYVNLATWPFILKSQGKGFSKESWKES